MFYFVLNVPAKQGEGELRDMWNLTGAILATEHMLQRHGWPTDKGGLVFKTWGWKSGHLNSVVRSAPDSLFDFGQAT